MFDFFENSKLSDEKGINIKHETIQENEEKYNSLMGENFIKEDFSIEENKFYDSSLSDDKYYNLMSEKEDLISNKEINTRELNDDEKNHLKDQLQWSDNKIKKCTIDEDGVIHYKTDRCDLEGKTSENGVPYKRKLIEINGIKIEGVFPEFNSVFDTQLDEVNYKSKAYAVDCNKKLKNALESDPELIDKFTLEQIMDIKEGRTPVGYVWHHNEEPGKMQLVKREDHDRTIGGASHTGGDSLWGASSVESKKKGESF